MLNISLIYKINSLGPNIEPCGMPHEIFRISGLHLYNYYIACTYIQAKLSVIILKILRASIYDEGVLSKGFMSGRSLCPDGVMCGGFFSKGVLSRGGLSRIHLVNISM